MARQCVFSELIGCGRFGVAGQQGIGKLAGLHLEDD